MPTRQELLASIAAKQAEIETAKSTHVAPLESDLASLRSQVEDEETTCGCSTLNKVSEGRYKCANADCQKEFDFPV